jgi:predicted nucleic acid-binding protein
MSAQRVLLDSAVPLLALGKPSRWTAACLAVLGAAADGSIDAFASTEMIQEVVFHRQRRSGDPVAAVADARDTAELVTLLPFDQKVLNRALRLIESSAQIRGRDAVHAATALEHGIGVIISPDDAFDGIPGLERVDPSALTE